MSELKVFKEAIVLDRMIQMYGTVDEPLFLAKDVAEWIEYDTSSLNKFVSMTDEDEKVRKIVPTLGGPQEMWFLTEDGLYEVLMQSRKPQAKIFKKEVKKILKSIRKTGGYIIGEETLDDSELLARALLVAQKKIEQREAEVKNLQDRVVTLLPKEEFYDSVGDSGTTILVGELAKILRQNGHEIGQNRLFSWLRENGYLINRRGIDYNMPTQKSMELGLFRIKETVVTHGDGSKTIEKTPRVTGRGQIYFVKLFLNNNDNEERCINA